MLLVLPVVLALPPFSNASSNFHIGQMAMVIPCYIGLIAAPAYLYLVFSNVETSAVSRLKSLWLRLSLFGALLASAHGIFFGSFMPFLVPPSLMSLFLSLKLLYRVEKSCVGVKALGNKGYLLSRVPLLFGVIWEMPLVLAWVYLVWKMPPWFMPWFWLLPWFWMLQLLYIIPGILIMKWKRQERSFFFATILGASFVILVGSVIFLVFIGLQSGGAL